MPAPPVKVVEKRRMFLPPEPVPDGPRCPGEMLGHPCMRVMGHAGMCFVNLDPGARFVKITSDAEGL